MQPCSSDHGGAPAGRPSGAVGVHGEVAGVGAEAGDLGERGGLGGGGDGDAPAAASTSPAAAPSRRVMGGRGAAHGGLPKGGL